jgi:hypothetical protein
MYHIEVGYLKYWQTQTTIHYVYIVCCHTVYTLLDWICIQSVFVNLDRLTEYEIDKMKWKHSHNLQPATQFYNIITFSKE